MLKPRLCSLRVKKQNDMTQEFKKKMSFVHCSTYSLSYGMHFRIQKWFIILDVKNEKIIITFKNASLLAFFVLVMKTPVICTIFSRQGLI